MNASSEPQGPDRQLAGPRSLVRNVLSNWAVLGGNVAYALFITPVVVHALEGELYGIWSFLNGLTAYSGLLYLGLGAAVIKFTALHRARHDQGSVNRLASVILSIYTVLGSICLVTLFAASEPITGAFAEPLSAEAAAATVATTRLLGVQLLCIFVGSAFAGVLSGHDRFDLVNVVQLIGIAIRFAAVPLLVQPARDPLLWLAGLMASVAALEAAALAVILFANVRGLALRLTRPTLAELRLLYGFGVQSFLILFSVRVISNTDTTVIGIRLGAAAVTPYALPLQLVEYGRTMVAGFAGVLLPRLTAMVTQGNHAGLRQAYLDAIRVASILAGGLAAVMIVLGPPFLDRWVGPEYWRGAEWVIVLLVTAMFAQVMSSQVPLAFYQAMHKVSFPAVVLGIEAVANLVLSVWLAGVYGLTGVAVATAIPALTISGAVLPAWLCRQLSVPLTTLLGRSVFPGLLMMAGVGASIWASGALIDSTTYTGIVARALTALPAALLVIWLTFPAEQLRTLMRVLRPSPRA